MVRRVISPGFCLVLLLAAISAVTARPACSETGIAPLGPGPRVNKTIVIVRPNAAAASERPMPPAEFLVPLTSPPRPLVGLSPDSRNATRSSSGPISTIFSAIAAPLQRVEGSRDTKNAFNDAERRDKTGLRNSETSPAPTVLIPDPKEKSLGLRDAALSYPTTRR